MTVFADASLVAQNVHDHEPTYHGHTAADFAAFVAAGMDPELFVCADYPVPCLVRHEPHVGDGMTMNLRERCDAHYALPESIIQRGGLGANNGLHAALVVISLSCGQGRAGLPPRRPNRPLWRRRS